MSFLLRDCDVCRVITVELKAFHIVTCPLQTKLCQRVIPPDRTQEAISIGEAELQVYGEPGINHKLGNTFLEGRPIPGQINSQCPSLSCRG